MEVLAHELDEAGCGVGRAGGCELRVADLLPGERAEVEVEHQSPHRGCAWARVRRRLGPPSPDRVTPPCPGFGRCGGCVWQHLAYPAQLARKRARVAAALARVGLAAEVAEVVAAPSPTGYRNKGKYVIAAGADGALVLGGFAPRSHEVVSTLGCRVVEPVIDQVAEIARQRLAGCGLPVYDERRRRGVLRYLIARSGSDGQVLLGLVTTSAAARAPVLALARELAATPAVAGVVWAHNDSHGGALLTREGRVEAVAGRATVIERVAGPTAVTLELGLGDFFQVHRSQGARICAEVAAVAAGAPGPALELYAGAGAIGFALAAAGVEVVAVEQNPDAVAAGRAAAGRAGLSDWIRFQAGDAAAIRHLGGHMGGQADGIAPGPPGGRRPGLIVVDPPRKGLAPQVRAGLIEAAPAQIVYVSCGPASLARDVAELVAAGYAIERVQPIDLMPGTPQVETVLSLRRGRPRPPTGPAPAPP